LWSNDGKRKAGTNWYNLDNQWNLHNRALVSRNLYIMSTPLFREAFRYSCVFAIRQASFQFHELEVKEERIFYGQAISVAQGVIVRHILQPIICTLRLPQLNTKTAESAFFDINLENRVTYD
jgi:hypothetical protein